MSSFARASINAEPALWNELLTELAHLCGKAEHSANASRKPFDPSKFGVSAEAWKEIGHAFHAASSPAYIFPASMVDSPAADAVETLLGLAENGNCSKGAHGARVYALDREVNSMGALLMGVAPTRLPGFIKTSDKEGSDRISKAWASSLPREPAPALESALEQGLIKGLFVQNAAALWEKDAVKWERLFKSVDFLILQEQISSPAMDLAQVVLPTAVFGEQEGSVINLEGRLLKLARVFDPAGTSLADWEIIAKIMAAQRLPSPENLSAVQKEISTLVTRYLEAREA